MEPNQVNVEIKLKKAEQSMEVSVPEIINDIDGLQNNLFDEDEQPCCRLCFGTAQDDSDLIEPCLCKGTIAKVHRKCLEKWFNFCGSTKCDLCLFEIRCERKLRYGLFESIGIWFRYHQNEQHPLPNLIFMFTMNIIALSMIIILLRNFFDLFSIAKYLPRWNLIFFGGALTIWLGIYSVICFILVNEQIRPWYRWWKSNKRIQLTRC